MNEFLVSEWAHLPVANWDQLWGVGWALCIFHSPLMPMGHLGLSVQSLVSLNSPLVSIATILKLLSFFPGLLQQPLKWNACFRSGHSIPSSSPQPGSSF